MRLGISWGSFNRGEAFKASVQCKPDGAEGGYKRPMKLVFLWSEK